MKTTSLLIAALAGLAAVLLSLSIDLPSLGLFSATAALLFLIGVVRDYSPRRPYWQPRAALVRFPSGAAARSTARLAA